MSLTHLTRAASVDDIVAELKATGALVVDRFLDDVRVDALNCEFDPVLAAEPLKRHPAFPQCGTNSGPK